MKNNLLALFSSSFLLSLMLSFLPCAQAEIKIATVNIDKVLNESALAKSVRKDLDQKSLNAKKAVDARRSSLKGLQEKAESAGNANDKSVEQYREKAKEFARYVKDTEEDLKRDFMKHNKQVMDKALAAIRKYAQDNKIDLVLADSEAMRGPLLFSNNQVDVTNQVIAQLNASK